MDDARRRTAGRSGNVTLAGIGLRPCDTVGLGTGNLRDVVRDVSGAAALGPADPPGHAIVRALAAALAGVPALAEDVGAPPDPAGAAGRRARATLRRRCATPPSPRPPTRAQRAAAHRHRGSPASRARADRAVGHHAARRRHRRPDRRRAGRPGSPRGRGARAPHRRCPRHAGAERRCPGSRRPSARSSRRKAPGRCSPACPPPRSPGCAASRPPPGSAPRLDPDWLETVAPVRPALARLEAVQLGQRIASGGRPLRAWTNRPGDPWQTVAATAVGHRGRAPVAARRRLRPARRAAGAAGRDDAGNGGRRRDRPLRRDGPRHGARQRRRVPARRADGAGAAGRRARGAAGRRRGADDRRARRHRGRGPRARPGADGGRRASWAPPPGSLHLAALPASGRVGRRAGSPLMPYRFDLHVRLEAIHTAARPAWRCEPRCAPEVHDPVWFLGRQWQLGEHRGRDAASPALVHLTVTETPVAGRSDRARGRPADHAARGDHRVRARAVVDDRAARARRAGAAQRRPAGAATTIPTLLLGGSGRAVRPAERSRPRRPRAVPARAVAGPGRRAVHGPGRAGHRAGRRLAAVELAYSATFTAGPTTLTIPRHDGGDVDWYSATATGPDPTPRVAAGGAHELPDTRRLRRRRPTRGGGRSRTTATTRAPSRRTARSSRR